MSKNQQKDKQVDNRKKKAFAVAFVVVFVSLSSLFLFMVFFGGNEERSSKPVEHEKVFTKELPSIPKESVYVRAVQKDRRSIGQKVLEEGTNFASSKGLVYQGKNEVEKQTEQYPTLRLFGGGGDGNVEDTNYESVNQIIAPYGRLISCETILTIDSNEKNTPIVGYVTDDLCHEGNVIIPAGTEVHGAGAGFVRDRIQASGEWIFVWRNLGDDCGKDLRLQGVALDNDRDLKTNIWGLTDGSMGIKGERVEPGESKEVKLIFSQLISGLTDGFVGKEKNTSTIGISTESKKGGVKNAFLQGGTQALDSYSQTLLQKLEETKPFVRVPAGKQFYIYVTQKIKVNA